MFYLSFWPAKKESKPKNTIDSKFREIKIGLKEFRGVLYCSNAEDVSNFLTYALIHVELTFLTTSKVSRKDNWDLGRKTSAEAII